MKKFNLLTAMAIVALTGGVLSGSAFAQTGTAVKESGKAVAEKAKRRRAVLESNPPRNNRLELIDAVSAGSGEQMPLPDFHFSIGSKDSRCLKKLLQQVGVCSPTFRFRSCRTTTSPHRGK